MADDGINTLSIQIGTPLRDVEKLVIESTLQHTGGNISQAARVLGIDRTTLYNKINKYKLQD